MMFDAAAAATVADAAAGDAAHPSPDFSGDAGAGGDRFVAPHAPVTPTQMDRAPDMARDTAVSDGHDWREAATGADPAQRDIIFIDTAVDDYRQLAAEWSGRGQVVLIDGTRDGVAQMQAALAGESGVGAIHIVSHGEEGAFWLGTTRVDQAAITGGLAQSLSQIGQALRPGGDILIYGCDFAEGTVGADALSAFAAATHADVAASTDTTGYAGRGGDWVLEAQAGAIEARTLDSGDWVHTLNPNNPVPISVTQDSLTVTDANGVVVTDGTTGYGTDARSPDVGVGAVAVWHGAATFGGQSVDLRATVVSLSAGDAIRFNRPAGGTGLNGDDPTFLLRDLTTGTSDATVTLKWELVSATTGQPLPADVRFTIADIDGIGGNPNTREGVTADTANLAYYTRERQSDINFVASLNAITASGTQNENTTANQPLTPKSAATFDWSATSAWTLSYKLTTNTVTTQAQFYQDGDADFAYTDPVYVSVPRLDLDRDDSTAPGNDAHVTFVENGGAVPVVDADLLVSNPMDVNSITGASVRLTNYRVGDQFTVGALPSNVSASVGPVSNGTVTIALSGLGSEADYTAALKAISFSNTSDRPDTTQRVIEVSFSNDTLTSAIATSRIDVVSVNDAPTANNDTATTKHDTPLTIAVLANDTDPEFDALVVTSATALHGNAAINPDSTITYTPNAGYNGPDTISYGISDGHGGTSSATVAVTVTPNTPPVATGALPARAALDAATVSYPTAGGFVDNDGDPLSYSATGLPAGLSINAATGVISGTLDRSASQANGGGYAITVTARDPSNATATQGFTLSVTNPAPTAANDSATTAEDTAVTIAVLANDSDPDGDPLTVTTASAAHGSVVRNANGTLTYTPDADYNGSDTLSYTISDGQGGTASAQVAVAITPVNDAPQTVATLPSRSANDAQAVSYPTASAFTDRDGDQLSYAATGLPAGLSIDATTGVITGTIDRSASQVGGGSYAVAVTARDPSNAATSQGFTITVANPGPTAANDGATTNEDTPVTIAVLANDTDPDGDPLTVTTASALHGGVVRNGDGTLTYTPAADYNGPDTISYQISDGQGGTSAAQVAVTVVPVDDAPDTVGSLPARTANDADAVSYPTAGAFSDREGDTLGYSAAGLPAGLAIDAATGVIAGTIDRSASQVNGGAYTVTVTARDPSNATAVQSFALTVANPGPTAADDSATTAEDTPVTIGVLANDSDPDGDPLTVTSATALHGSVVRNGDGTITYTPDADYNGSDTISYRISDGQGGTAAAQVALTVTPVNDAPRNVPVPMSYLTRDGATVTLSVRGAFTDPDGDTLTYAAAGLPAGLAIDATTGVIAGTVDRSASQIGGGRYTVSVTAIDPSGANTTQFVTLTVTNPAPTATDDSATTAEDTPVTIAVLGNDSDPDGDPLSVSAASALHGTVVRNADGTLTYTPDADYNGADTISYTISDGEGGTAAAQVAVTVTPVNDAPRSTVPSSGYTVFDGATVSIPASFSDPDGDALTYAATGLPAGLAIDPTTGVISGAMDRSASQVNGGRYPLTLTATDPSGAQATQAVLLTVLNPAPTARDDSATTAEDTAVTVAVLANDTDPDGDPLTVTGASALHGGVAINADGTLTYTPDANYNGADTISYQISDGQGGTAAAQVAVTVTPVNDAPVPAGALSSRAALDGASVSYPTAGGFADVDGDALAFTAAGLPAGLSIDPATGVISGTIDRSASQASGGRYAVTVTATDPAGASAVQGFAIDVANPAPVANDDAVTTHVDTPVTIAVLSNDGDPDNDRLTVASTGQGAHGSVAINADGTLRYTPHAGYAGPDSFVYTISDGEGATASAIVRVDIANAAPVAAPLAPVAARDGEAISLPLAARFSDADNDALRYTATGLPVGLSIDPVTGVVSGAIDRRASQANGGSYDAVVTADDGHGGRTSAPLHFDVTNPAPIASDDTATTPEDTPVTIVVLGNDTDPDGDPLTVTAATAAHGAVLVNADGSITYMPAPDFNGVDTITYQVADGDGGTASASVRVTVTPVNDAPVAVRASPPAVATADGATLAIDAAPWFRDVDGGTLTYSAVGLPAGLSIDPATGTIRGTVDHSASQANGGRYPVIVTARDAAGANATAGFDIRATNPAPVADDDTARTAQESAGVVIPVLANDRDPDGDPLVVLSATADHGVATVNADGTVTYVAGGGFTGADTIRYRIDDGEGGTADAVVTVAVDPIEHPPVAGNPAPVDAVGGQPVRLSVLPTASDADGDPLRVVAATTATGTVTVNPDGTLLYSPPLGFAGTTTVSYTISDGRGGAATGSILVRVADGRGADIEQLLRIGRVTFRDPTPPLAVISVGAGDVRNPLILLDTIDHIRSLRSTAIGEQPVGDAVEAIRTLRGTGVGPDTPVLDEVARLDRLRDERDAGDRLFDPRWSDFDARPLAGFSAAADRQACVMIESVVRGGAIFVEVRDTAQDGRAAIRSIDVRLGNGRPAPDWIKVDPRGLAIIERAADADELHLVVRVTRTDGRTTATPIVIQGATGEIELDRHQNGRSGSARPLDHTLATPSAAIQSEAARLASLFQ